MTTPVMMPVIWVMLQFYPGAGTAVPTPKVGNNSVMATYLTRDLCERDRSNHSGAPEDYFCVEYRSDKFIEYTFSQDTKGKDRQGAAEPPVPPSSYGMTADDEKIKTSADPSVGPTVLAEKDKPYIERMVTPSKQKRVVVRRQRQPFDPFAALASLLTPRDW
jgi:hypothetical protein